MVAGRAPGWHSTCCKRGVIVYRFEDLRVWQAAKQQSDCVGGLIRRPPFRVDREIADQMNGAALSVMLNIAEGFLRRRDKETAQFLRYAIGSNGELKAAYYGAEGRQYITGAETADLIASNESIAKMLRRWMSTLKTDDERSRGGGPRTKAGPGTKDGPETKDGPGTTN